MDDKVVAIVEIAAAAVAVWWVQEGQDVNTTTCDALTKINQNISLMCPKRSVLSLEISDAHLYYRGVSMRCKDFKWA